MCMMLASNLHRRKQCWKSSIFQDVIDRVAFLVGRHQTDTGIDGVDFQILMEADCLVNLCEEGASESAVWSAARRIFRTESGKRLCRLMFGRKND